jgi:predicted CxxxxCH...CXXCH cytochrome family protein
MENQTKVHRINWYPDVQLNHRAYAASNGTASCANASCHGSNLTGVAQSGPSCSTCHSWPYNGSSCGSCHGIPPSGTAFPNITGSHSVHTTLATATSCAACHEGAGSGTALHYNSIADVILTSAYNAESGAASFNATALTCSSVSCHGGKVTPTWRTGTIDVNTQCTSCHASGTAQFNSYNSGRHSKHSSYGCAECHDTTKLAFVHFNDLNTTAMTQAYQTLLDTLNYTGTGGGSFGNCTLTCHSKSHNGLTW